MAVNAQPVKRGATVKICYGDVLSYSPQQVPQKAVFGFEPVSLAYYSLVFCASCLNFVGLCFSPSFALRFFLVRVVERRSYNVVTRWTSPNRE